MEHDHLAQANRHIAAGERHVANQEALILRLLEQGLGKRERVKIRDPLSLSSSTISCSKSESPSIVSSARISSSIAGFGPDSDIA